MNFIYSEKLIKQVKECYPNFKRMHELAENGDYILGRFLDDMRTTTIPLCIILKAKTLDELKKIAIFEQKKAALYKLWEKETF